MVLSKQLLGQYYTTTDPFNNSGAFRSWYQMVPKTTILEPFAGAGHLFSYVNAEWHGYDIEPNHPDVEYRNTFEQFPTGYRVCITNPPYLAKTVVSRKKLPVQLIHEDMYLDALQLMLDNCEYVAAIVPSTFWNQRLFKDRLYAWDKFDMQLFTDTDAPAGVAYFVPHRVEHTRTFVNGDEIVLTSDNTPTKTDFHVRFNPHDLAPILVNGIDTNTQNNIHLRMLQDNDVPSLVNSMGKCKPTNRNHFPIESTMVKEADLPAINALIEQWRDETMDFFLTSFKSPMASGKYRKRISFMEVRWLLNRFYADRLSETPPRSPTSVLNHL
ncbi:DNA methyltransferase [Synechococcus phage ACG-2014e]|uniref:DNA methyltransferase n=1 Tax=Synechococcus phage ACG-2014e TaxID=1493510 RepID=A0A0E3F1T0_9CAUD|nr:DNA methyltransferase [Synechococcus phage ACG-2014e]YP_010355661.1 DNA methyltransferase [Synechococcus phage ACG-2014e]AIX20512.1 hypothetical protein Syn7803C85_49 [Synechococcus phage ACG-2014e]AIX29728.1 hypothetical protein Syn7803US33_47 [Synechococcus phage ACG-2014e]AIX44967.1 hypothetical protein Syn7803C2_48 [Synechococcus phage ACG-2014e]